jgi:hypothetical protein
MSVKILLGAWAVAALLLGCKKEQGNKTTETPTNNDELAVYKKIYGASSIAKEGDFVVIKSNALPDHKSPYYQGTQWAATLFEAYNGNNPSWSKNPNKIVSFNLTFKIPLNPKEAAVKASTPMGPIGISLNGVPFFNQYAAGGSPLTNEINGFDQHLGHPMQLGMYHYHIEPIYLTTKFSKNTLLGFLLDGFPVYGPMENNKTITNADLDTYHGHSHATLEYPNGIYHYHITNEDPYLNGGGFYGVAGTVAQ